MLVLSRRESDKILFPSLGISVEVLRVQGNKVRLGIEAPEDVPVLRHEIADLKDIEFSLGTRANDQRLRKLLYAMRTHLDRAAVRLNELHRSLDDNADKTAQSLIEQLYRELEELEREANRVLEDSGIEVRQTPQVLLVEDSAPERKLLEAFLELSGLEVITANDGREALDYLSLHAAPDVVLLDMMMPHVDGPAFVRAVRSDPKLRKMSVFALTAMDQQDTGLPTGPEGVDRWYVKPVNPKELVADVATHLASSPLMVA